MAATCAHCKRPIGCGCQQTTTSNGKIVHKACKTAYETSLKVAIAK